MLGTATSSRMNNTRGSNAFVSPVGAWPGRLVYERAMPENSTNINAIISSMPKMDLVMLRS